MQQQSPIIFFVTSSSRREKAENLLGRASLSGFW
jgi:hypothetical protein